MAFHYISTPNGAVFSFLFFSSTSHCFPAPPGNKVGTLFSKEAAQQVKQEWLQAQKEQSADFNKPVKLENTAPRDMAVRARTASRALQSLSSRQREQLLHKIAENLLAKEEEIMQENDKDCQVGCLGQQVQFVWLINACGLGCRLATVQGGCLCCKCFCRDTRSLAELYANQRWQYRSWDNKCRLCG